jgi:hypothetical protein
MRGRHSRQTELETMEEFITRVLMGLSDRVGGPMTFRIILQPLMAGLFAVRAGLRDAREGRPPYLWTILTDSSQRAALIREGWRAVVRVFILAIVMDVIYQLIVRRWIYPGETLIVAVVLAVFPYLLLRGPINRLVRRFRRQSTITTEG